MSRKNETIHCQRGDDAQSNHYSPHPSQIYMMRDEFVHAKSIPCVEIPEFATRYCDNTTGGSVTDLEDG